MAGLREQPVEERRSAWRRVPPTPALDGLRGVAIAVVTLFHYPTHLVFVGGLFGVGVFFVLSGFLVTPILAAEHDRTGGVQLGRFYRRRAWRLLPALVAFLALFLVMAVLFGRTGWFQSTPFGPAHAPGRPLSVTGAVASAAAGLGYIYNILLAHNFTLAGPLGHLWTLSVEGQFYLAWALVLPRLLRLGPRLVASVMTALIVVSAASPFLCDNTPASENWIYFSSVPQVQDLLAGALLAQMWALGWLRRIPAWAFKAGGAAGAALFAYLVFAVGNVPLKYWGGITLTAGAGVLLVAYLIEAGPASTSLGSRILSSSPLVWLGKRSYAIYLWHWPLAMWTNQLPHEIGVPLGLGATLVLAEASWWLVEAPAQRWARRRELRPEPAMV